VIPTSRQAIVCTHLCEGERQDSGYSPRNATLLRGMTYKEYWLCINSNRTGRSNVGLRGGSAGNGRVEPCACAHTACTSVVFTPSGTFSANPRRCSWACFSRRSSARRRRKCLRIKSKSRSNPTTVNRDGQSKTLLPHKFWFIKSQ
jgi:hypothetical protein